jgi:DNA-binding PadR family transcriptional regulator
MALRNAVMAALLEGEASGYDLAKGFEASVANFWMATPQQIYRELERMEGEGLVRARVVQQERRPNKRLFSLTEAGLDAMRAYTAEVPSKPTAIRDELLVKVSCVDIGDAEAVRAGVAERVERAGPYLTLLGGMTLEQGNIQWGETVLRRLDQRAEALGARARG